MANFNKMHSEEAVAKEKDKEDEEALKNLNDILKTAGSANAKLE